MKQPVFVLAIAIAAALPAFSADARYGLEKAKANMSTFKTADGLQSSLFAAEPMVQNPTNIEVDHKGRVWAVECTNYRGHMSSRAEGDRVVILEDTDGDGLADVEKTFYQSKDLTNPARHLCAAFADGQGHSGDRERCAECVAADGQGRRR